MFSWLKKFDTKNIEDPGDLFTEQEIEFYLLLIYYSNINKNILSPEYHTKITSAFERALYQGYGGDLLTFNFNSPQWENIRDLRKSLYVFSAAKQYSQVREMSSFINVNGERSEYKLFKEKAIEVFDAYNKNYLKTEYSTAIGQAQMAREYTDAVNNKHVTPLLQYRTQRDARVRDEHAILDGITLPVDDPFWRYNMPKNGWNCFTGETKVLTPKGWVRIDSIKPNSKVIGGGGKEQNVNSVHVNNFNGTVTVIKINERFIFCTDNHRFLTKRGWIMAKNLFVDDEIVQIKLSDYPVAQVNNVNAFSDLIKSIKSHWQSNRFKNLNTNIGFWAKNINPMMRNIVVMFSFFMYRINNHLLINSWFGFTKHILFGIGFVKRNSRFLRFLDYFRYIKRAGNFKLFSHFRHFIAGSRMGVFFIKFFKELTASVRSFLSSFRIVYPLSFNSLATNSNGYIILPHQIDYLSGLQFPSGAQHSVSEHLLNIQIHEGFSNTAPLNRFDSLDSFMSNIHNFDLNKISFITKIRYIGNVYNLEVENDNSYITEAGISHNCRCFTVPMQKGRTTDLSQRDLSDLQDETKFPKLFRMNPAIDGYIFDPKQHPYFRVAKGDSGFKKANYNLFVP